MFLWIMEPIQFQVKKFINFTIQFVHLSIICIERTATICFGRLHLYDLNSTQTLSESIAHLHLEFFCSFA